MSDNYKMDVDLEILNGYNEKLGGTDLTLESVNQMVLVEYKLDVNFKNWGIDGVLAFGLSQTISFNADLSQAKDADESGFVDEDIESYSCDVELDSTDFTIEENASERRTMNAQIYPKSLAIKMYDIVIDKKSRSLKAKAKATLTF